MSDLDRYLAAVHAMQSGVAFEMNYPATMSATEPKHLRVGVNAAMVDHAGLVTLLEEKGIITRDEYIKAIADAMEREVASYQERADEQLGRPGVVKFK